MLLLSSVIEEKANRVLEVLLGFFSLAFSQMSRPEFLLQLRKRPVA